MESNEVILAKLSSQMESLTKEICALRKQLADQAEYHEDATAALHKIVDRNRYDAEATKSHLTELKGMLRGGTMVLAFFQTIMFGAIFWIFSTTYNQQTDITQLQGGDAQIKGQIDILRNEQLRIRQELFKR